MSDITQDRRIDWASVREWLTCSLGRGWRVESLAPLSGATSSTLVAVDATRGQRNIELVLRLYTLREWLVEVPDVPAREATNLALAGQAPGLPVPGVINVDAWGGQCRYADGEPLPALLMERLPGRVVLPQRPDAAYLHGLAEAIAPLHALDGATLWRTYAPYVDVDALAPPSWSAHRDSWERVIRRVREPWPGHVPCMIHRDYHPCNVLWRHGGAESAVSGIVDWPLACRGPAQIDAAWCRMNLVNLYGVDVANAYTEAWRDVEGGSEPHDPFWDMIVLIEALDGDPEPYAPWAALGGPRITQRDVVAHREAWVQQLAAGM